MHIRVNGNPAPQGSVSAFAIKKDGAYTGRTGLRSDNPALGAWREAVRAEAQRALPAELAMRVHPPPEDGYLYGPGRACSVEIRFYLARPKSHYGTGRNAGQVKPSAPNWPMGGKRGDDFDKLLRAVCDALQAAGVVADDKQFVGTPGVWKVYADFCAPGADIWVCPAPDGLGSFTLVDPHVRLGELAEPLRDLRTGDVLVNPDFSAIQSQDPASVRPGNLGADLSCDT